MSDFEVVAAVGDIDDPGKLAVEIQDRIVILIKTGGKFYCIDDVCTHDGGSFDDGELCGTTISCPRHGATFDVCSGNALTMPATEATSAHEVKVEGDKVLVRLSDD
jgi:3-phenylpropionate/trans-cinnamate dioxygenase ferredoxin subunit